MKARWYVVMLAYVPFVYAGIRPSFWLSRCAWEATEVLELAVTPNAEGFRVVAAIKGVTRPGAIKVFPELAPPAEDHRLLKDLVSRFPGGLRGPAYQFAPPIRDVDRLIVFLGPHDQPANYTMLTSTIWLQDGSAYAFVQTNNPGPTHLIPLLSVTEHVESGGRARRLYWKGETQVRADVSRLLDLRATFDNAVANPNPTERVADLARLVRSGDDFVVRSVLARLSSDGPEAAHALLPLLDDDGLLNTHFQILDAMAMTGAHDIRLGSIVVREKDYWEQTCQQPLENNWLRNYGQPPANHYLRLFSALKTIRALGLTADLPSVAKFNELLSHCPVLSERWELRN